MIFMIAAVGAESGGWAAAVHMAESRFVPVFMIAAFGAESGG
ncbi:MAG TPA: hypothetical protein VEZ11_18480 [Thermoanaerobaculia bacterium]|nr:hypothetical protein [Thermoanaerobaculia bacterium]